MVNNACLDCVAKGCYCSTNCFEEVAATSNPGWAYSPACGCSFCQLYTVLPTKPSPVPSGVAIGFAPTSPPAPPPPAVNLGPLCQHGMPAMLRCFDCHPANVSPQPISIPMNTIPKSIVVKGDGAFNEDGIFQRRCLTHQPVDTGMRRSWCKKCDVTLVMDGLEWREVNA